MKLGQWHHLSMSISSTITRSFTLNVSCTSVTWCFFFHKEDKIMIHSYISSFQFFPLFYFYLRNLFHFCILFYFFLVHFFWNFRSACFFHTHKVANLQVYIPLNLWKGWKTAAKMWVLEILLCEAKAPARISFSKVRKIVFFTFFFPNKKIVKNKLKKKT